MAKETSYSSRLRQLVVPTLAALLFCKISRYWEVAAQPESTFPRSSCT